MFHCKLYIYFYRNPNNYNDIVRNILQVRDILLFLIGIVVDVHIIICIIISRIDSINFTVT